MPTVSPRAVAFVCPRCRAAVHADAAAYRCDGCGAAYPVVAGIPDFRVFPDPWIGLEADRAKALRVAEATRGLDLEASVRAYWAMTPDTPRDRAERFVDHVLRAEARTREWLDRTLETDAAAAAAAGPWLDLGCGTADLAVAAAGRAHVVGIDIALRWLVIARKRLEAAGLELPLVCCCAERLPFPDGTFGRTFALGLLEHCARPEPVLEEARRVLRPGGALHLRTVNRYTVLREPHVDLWGVGFVPRRWADAYVRLLSGARYLHHRPPSRRELARALRRAGFAGRRVRPARLLDAESDRLGPAARRAAPVYERLRRVAPTGALLSWLAPLLEAEGVRP